METDRCMKNEGVGKQRKMKENTWAMKGGEGRMF